MVFFVMVVGLTGVADCVASAGCGVIAGAVGCADLFWTAGFTPAGAGAGVFAVTGAALEEVLGFAAALLAPGGLT
jgi:hypothetical protein